MMIALTFAAVSLPGMGLIAAPSFGQLAITLLISEEFKNGNMRGLYGNYNGNRDDDLTSRSGHTIATTSNDQTIYKSFGMTCKYVFFG